MNPNGRACYTEDDIIKFYKWFLVENKVNVKDIATFKGKPVVHSRVCYIPSPLLIISKSIVEKLGAHEYAMPRRFGFDVRW